ncbi:MAG: ABC-type transport auxiliary lipoprotein family protein [Pseudomonadota bacterium]
MGKSLAALAATTCLILAGCLSVLPEQAVPNALYRLDAITVNDDLTRNVVVREPTSVRVFGGLGMVVEGRDGGLRLIENVEWAGRLTRLMQKGLVDALSGAGEGVAVTELSGVPGDLEVSWHIADMTIIGDAAVCDLDLTVLDGRTREPLAVGAVRESVGLDADSSAGRAQALSSVGSACVETAAAFVASVTE